MGNNFDLAPPVKIVDGLVAVPIDIQRITASLVFDGATQSGQGDATLEFIMGPQNGNPIFDLRQTITAAWLDGAPLPPGKLNHHDFGGGPHANLRVVEAVLAAGSAHTLRVTYNVALPQASMAGSYLPAITWSSGPRLTFNFGFTDLGAGRYLEAWVPANLIFDQFELTLTLQVLNTAVAHTVITNGTVTPAGVNHWSIAFPSRFTAFSPLLELRPGDEVTSMTGTVTLPVSGKVVTIEAWKLASSPLDLGTHLNNLKGWLAANENSTGPYFHGNRFVAFLYKGGMEYDGGTTSSTGALQHETFHSWWARGLKPASQPDAWFDEAWTVYKDQGASGAFPFNFSDPPVELCPRNPWSRITAPGAYNDGNRFWEGVAALVGVGKINELMSKFYQERWPRPATTAALEEFLVCQTGNPQLVDAFHRFVYGCQDPAPKPDLWLRDAPAHGGGDAWAGRFWDSPDLWVRNADDGGTDHQSPEYGQDNWLYARVRNRSATAAARHFLVTFQVKPFAGTEFLYPGDFLPCQAAAAGFDLGPGGSTIVKARWLKALVPQAGIHTCLLAAVLTRADHPVAGRHVWEHNNLAQKNLTIVDLVPGAWIVLPFVLASLKTRAYARRFVELVRPANRVALEASLIHAAATPFRPGTGFELDRFSHAAPPGEFLDLDCSAGKAAVEPTPALDKIITSDRPELFARRFAQGVALPFPQGQAARLPVSMRPQDQLLFGLKLKVPHDAHPGEILLVDLVQRDAGGKNIIGGLAVAIQVK